jgi:hypothetical protein
VILGVSLGLYYLSVVVHFGMWKGDISLKRFVFIVELKNEQFSKNVERLRFMNGIIVRIQEMPRVPID